MDLMKKYLGEGRQNKHPQDKYNNPQDTWLEKNGWKETHGIALYTNPKYPSIGVDTNSGNANIEVFKNPQKVFNDEGAMMDYTSKVQAMAKAIEKGSVVYTIYKAIEGRKGYKSYHLTGSSISMYADGYGVNIFTDTPKLVVTLSGYNVKGRDKGASIHDTNYKVSFPFNKGSIRNIVKQIATWEKQQWT